MVQRCLDECRSHWDIVGQLVDFEDHATALHFEVLLDDGLCFVDTDAFGRLRVKDVDFAAVLAREALSLSET